MRRGTVFAMSSLLLCAAAAGLTSSGTLLALSQHDAPRRARRTLTFEERVSYQRAIEDAYWRHRIWPKENADAKASLDAVMSQKQLEKKVNDYLRNSQALEDYWQRPITAEQLQAEMDRMAEHTKQPEVLRELFDALGNDPFVIAECLARPALADRLITNWYAYDQRIHGELKQRAETELQTRASLEQMKQLSGKYTEIELIRQESAHGRNTPARRSMKLNNHEWDDTVQKLVGMFSDQPVAAGVLPAKGRPMAEGPKARGAANDKLMTHLTTGTVSPLQEDETRYYATAMVNKSAGHLKLATVSWLKEPLESWRARVEKQAATALTPPGDSYKLPPMSQGDGCVEDTWTATAGPPDARASYTAVWTGSEMIVWGGLGPIPLNTGGRYKPSPDNWVATTTTNAPGARSGHTAVWTGTEMIVWGATADTTGGRYNPVTNNWTATSTTNAPDFRYYHTAVWTGTEMVVWGGANFLALNTGGRYNPSTNSWTATSITDAPSGRRSHTAVWTGSEMIVWGGNNEDSFDLNTGGRYNPTSDSWTATTTVNAPASRSIHTAVWTGSEMIVWGGVNFDFVHFNTGGRYSPSTDSWVNTGTANAPLGRMYHTTVWTGSEMIVWGGQDGEPQFHALDTGG